MACLAGWVFLGRCCWLGGCEDLSWRGVSPGRVALPWVRGPLPACVGIGGPCTGMWWMGPEL